MSLKVAIIPLVREFYVNAVEATNDFVFVRGKLVPFLCYAINEFYEAPNFENDGYGQYLG